MMVDGPTVNRQLMLQEESEAEHATAAQSRLHETPHTQYSGSLRWWAAIEVVLVPVTTRRAQEKRMPSHPNLREAYRRSCHLQA